MPGSLALAPGHKQPDVPFQSFYPLFQSPAQGGGNAAAVPVKAQNAAEGLKPVRVGQAPQHLLRPEIYNDGQGDFPRQLHHALEKPGRGLAVMKR